MFEQPLVFVSMFFPIIIGTLNYAKFDTAYRFLFYSICFWLINQVIFSLFKFMPLWNNVFNYASHLLILSLNTWTIILWSNVQRKSKIITVFIAISVITIFFEIYWIGIEEYRTSIALSISSMLAQILTIHIIFNLITQKLLLKKKISILFFMIPSLVVKTYGNSIDLFMFFLYEPATAGVFLNLWEVYLYLGVIYYIFIGLSLLLVTKKDVFI
jgi:hypothetical protein